MDGAAHHNPRQPSGAKQDAKKRNIAGRAPHVVVAYEGAWAVFDADGVRITGRLNQRTYARALAREMNTSLSDVRPKNERECLCCAVRFLSEGPHNRLCDICRRRGSSEKSPNSFARGARR